MTNLEQWAHDLAANLLLSDEEAERGIETTLHQRLAISLLQARAHECRQQEGSILIKNLDRHPAFATMRRNLVERSRELEAVGLKMAKQFPPVDEPKLVDA